MIFLKSKEVADQCRMKQIFVVFGVACNLMVISCLFSIRYEDDNNLVNSIDNFVYYKFGSWKNWD